MTTLPIAKAPMAAAPNARAPIATAPTDAARIEWAAVRTAGFVSTDVSDCWPMGSFLRGWSMILILLHAAGSGKLRRGLVVTPDGAASLNATVHIFKYVEHHYDLRHG